MKKIKIGLLIVATLDYVVTHWMHYLSIAGRNEKCIDTKNGFIFNKDTFVVNKEYVLNARDEDFVEGTALLPEHLFILENQTHGIWELVEHEYEDCAKCSQCAVEFSLTGEWSFEDYLYYMHFCPNCGAFMREDDNGKE